MRCPEKAEIKQMPLEDVLAVIIAARGVSLSSNLISALASQKAIILHCDECYRPIALTAPLVRTTRTEVIVNQTNLSSELHQRLWRRIVQNKVRNQMRNLQVFGNPSPDLMKKVEEERFSPDESLWARRYWKEFFALAGVPEDGRDQQCDTPLNAMLNYGYAVLQAVVHRAIVVHGMIPNLGFHHAIKYDGDPLVYDLMEPFRAFVDAMILRFCKTLEPVATNMRAWMKHVANEFVNLKVQTPFDTHQRMLHAIDLWVKEIANCLCANTVSYYWEIILDKEFLQNGLDYSDV